MAFNRGDERRRNRDGRFHLRGHSDRHPVAEKFVILVVATLARAKIGKACANSTAAVHLIVLKPSSFSQRSRHDAPCNRLSRAPFIS